MKNTAKKFDQFFTQDEVAKECLDNILGVLKRLRYDVSELSFVEPAAGEGAFVRALQSKKLPFLAYDIDVKQSYIKQRDYLTQNISRSLPKKEKTIVVGNPPFGKRARLAIDFVNKSFQYSDTVAFILPIQFEKYSAQKQIDSRANLVYSQKLDENIFLFQGEEYGVRCCLQIWTLKQGMLADLRLEEPPEISHKDFEMWQYNNTKEAEKYFDRRKYKWDFAVPRQGYKDYTIKEFDPKNMDRRTQWIFFKAKNQNILRNLKKLDFEKLSRKNTSTPGFGKADVIQAYKEMFGQEDKTHTFQLGDPSPSFAG